MSEESSVCLRCGRDSISKKLEVDPEVIKDYFRCSLGNRPFTKKFSIMDGQLEATFELIPAELELALDRYIRANSNASDVSDIRMLLSLTNVSVYSEEESGLTTIYRMSSSDRAKVLENPEKALKEMVGGFDAVMLGVLRRMNITFIILVNTILENIINEDFYEGVGLL